MNDFLRSVWKRGDIPKGVRTLTLATAIRWLGWGFAESLIPVFIYSFGTSFAQAGLLKSGYDVALIIGLPIIGALADRMRASTLILIGLFVYLFVGVSYLLAGITGYAVYVVIARFLNGVGFGLDSVGRGAYFRRHTPPQKTATVFGYFDTIANFWWIVAAVCGIFLVKYFSIAQLLFLITPTAAIAGFIVWKFRRSEPSPVVSDIKDTLLVREVLGWNGALKGMVVCNFFIAAASGVVAFFLPIEAYNDGASLGAVIFMGIIATSPTLFGWSLGKVFDSRGPRLFVYGLVLFAVFLLSLAFFHTYLWKIVAFFSINIVVELLSVGSNELITVHAQPEHFGRVDGIIRSIADIGMLAGPLAVGIMIDTYGVPFSYLALGGTLLALAGAFAVFYRRGMGRPVVS